MIQASDYRTSKMTSKPGVYVFRDAFAQVIYVGKAKSLRKRLGSYFQPSRRRTADPKLRSLINSIETVEVFPVKTDEEAVLLESRFIKQYNPRYNIVLRDDKRFLLIKIDLRVPFPRLMLARLRKDDNCMYFGPFPYAGVVRETIDHLSRFYGLRSCTVRRPGEKDFEHCSNHIIRTCTAPCVGKITQEDYRKRMDRVMEVLAGDTKEVIEDLETKMQKLAERHDFERAAKTRDIITNIRSVCTPTRTFARASISTFPGPEAVAELQSILEMDKPPTAIECFDNSNISGTSAVAAMVRFVNGAPSRKDYRHYKIKTVEGPDDFASMNEVVRRRYSRLADEQKPMPDLIVIDGGKGQLAAAYQVLLDLDLTDVPIIGLAKRQEEIFTIYSPDPVIVEHHRPALRLLQAIRDEAHRFAITFHRDLRRKRILNSLLDEIPGVGKKRKEQLLKAFGSVRNMRKYSAADIVERVPGCGETLAEQIMDYLKRE
jgi:excinuclease ABC subunit C